MAQHSDSDMFNVGTKLLATCYVIQKRESRPGKFPETVCLCDDLFSFFLFGYNKLGIRGNVQCFCTNVILCLYLNKYLR